MMDNENTEIERELQELFEWFCAEQNKVCAQIAETTGFFGLDGNAEMYKYIYDELDRRLNEIRRRHGIDHEEDRSH